MEETKVKRTATDYKIALTDTLHYFIRYNEIAHSYEVNGEPITDGTAACIRNSMRDIGFIRDKWIDEGVIGIGMANTYNPIKDYLESLKWDGVSRIKGLVSCLQPKNQPLAESLFTKWLVGAVSKVYKHTQNMMLVVVGEQGTGKSRVAEWLCSDIPKYFKSDDIHPDKVDDKISVSQNFIWEVGELGRTTTKADIESLKAFITSKEFKVRKPYGRNEEYFINICSWFGTVNPSGKGFLHDDTGNRRFWIIESQGILWEYSKAYKPEQIWAEAKALYDSDYTITLTEDEKAQNEEAQGNYKALDLIAEAVLKYYDVDPQREDLTVSISDVFETLTHAGYKPNNTNLGIAMKKLGVETRRPKIKGNKVSVYVGLRKKEI